MVNTNMELATCQFNSLFLINSLVFFGILVQWNTKLFICIETSLWHF